MTANQESPPTAASTDETHNNPGELLRQIVQRDFDLVRGEDDLAYLRPRDGGPYVHLVGGEKLRSQLRRAYRLEASSSPTKRHLEELFEELNDMAEELEQSTLSRRVAQSGSRITLDLADPEGRVVVVRPGKWRVRHRSSELFVRSKVTGPLPVPDKNGDLELLRQFVNVPDRLWPVVKCVALSWFFPRQASPILQLLGTAGAAKSTTTQVLKGLLDPINQKALSPILRAPKNDEAFTVACCHQHLVAYNNVSTLPLWWQDALCRYVTGDMDIDRTKYSNYDLSTAVLQGPVILNGITMGSLRHDLAQRTVVLDLRKISKTERRYDADMAASWEKARPQVLGGLLDLLSTVLASLSSVRLAENPRMADFARICAAYDTVTGDSALRAYLREVEALPGRIVEEDAVAHAVKTFAVQQKHWSGTARQLAAALPQGETSLPTDPAKLSERLRRVEDVLAEVGVFVTRRTSNGSKLIELRYTPRDAAAGRRRRADRVAKRD